MILILAKMKNLMKLFRMMRLISGKMATIMTLKMGMIGRIGITANQRKLIVYIRKTLKMKMIKMESLNLLFLMSMAILSDKRESTQKEKTKKPNQKWTKIPMKMSILRWSLKFHLSNLKGNIPKERIRKNFQERSQKLKENINPEVLKRRS
jgi:hypothetical protein